MALGNSLFKNRQAGITTIAINLTNEAETEALLTGCTGKAPKDFFAGMPFVADLNQAQSTDAAQLLMLKQQFYNHGLTLIGVTNHQCHAQHMADAGLADIQLGQPPEKRAPTASPATHASPSLPTPVAAEQIEQPGAKVIHRHVRSGQRIYAQGQDLIIIGTVGAGAEVIADGHISIYGSLRGRAFAGAKGGHEYFIYCSELAAELISIAGCYQTMEQLESLKGQRDCLITLDADERMQVRSLMP